MTSLFELPEQGRGLAMPVDLIPVSGRGVAMLEFFALDEEQAELDARAAARRAAADDTESATQERARQTRVMVDAARAEARAEARREFESELHERLAAERARTERVIGDFAGDRQRYFAAAEGQVVKLALAIAKRILAREVAADAMHLTATVRAALTRVHDGSKTVLRVPEAEVAAWAGLFSGAVDGSVSVVGDERLVAGECVLETDVGRVELGVAVQVAEIERGFGELMRRQGE